MRKIECLKKEASKLAKSTKAIAPEVVTEAKPSEKEPWEMDKDDFGYANQVNIERSQLARDRDVRRWEKRHDEPNVVHEAIDSAIERINKESLVAKEHKSAIKQAVKQGKPVPREVLEEYKEQKWTKEALAKS